MLMNEKLRNFVIALIENEVKGKDKRDAYYEILNNIIEPQEIPQMEGTMDMLNNLTIR